jgi:hypothetical protein
LKMVSYAFLSPNKFGDFVDPIELEIKDTTRSVSFLDIRFKIDSEGRNFMLVSSFCFVLEQHNLDFYSAISITDTTVIR